VNNSEKYYLTPAIINNFMPIYLNIINSSNLFDIIISGGEPTLSPYFLDIVDLCSQAPRVNSIIILSNGAPDPSLFIKAKNIINKKNKLLSICMSIHESQLQNIENYVDKINYLLDSNINVSPRVVINTKNITENMLLYLQLNNIKISPLFGSDVTNLQDMTDINLHNSKNKLLIHYDDDSEEICSLYDVTIQKHNPFKGYYCTSLYQNITIDEKGYIFPSCFTTKKYFCWSNFQTRHLNRIMKQHMKCSRDMCECYNKPIRYKDIKLLPYLINKQKEDIIKYGYNQNTL